VISAGTWLTLMAFIWVPVLGAILLWPWIAPQIASRRDRPVASAGEAHDRVALSDEEQHAFAGIIRASANGEGSL
jgi:hypothetical protein